ncbi:MAG: chromosomal replication initiator protein DnaA, partial [Hyphomicrobiaceae bacterium]|nr:chromosomal replication initiator protein DnaA [Hyphomicrobiaceae bacterium]
MTDENDYEPRPAGCGAGNDLFGVIENRRQIVDGQERNTFRRERQVGFVPPSSAVIAGNDDIGIGAEAVEGDNSASAVASRGQKVKTALRARLGDDVYSSWFGALEMQSFDGSVLKVSVPVKFLKSWIQTHYSDALLACAGLEFNGVERVEVVVREPAGRQAKAPETGRARSDRPSDPPRSAVEGTPASLGMPSAAAGPRSQVNGFEGSPLDPRYTFESFVVGPANRMAQAGAIQVAETIFSEQRGFNPLFIHSSVGHGKSHLLQAIAWEVRRRTPHAKVLYLTAERFRFTFVEALKAQDAMAFKERFRAIDMLLIDDLEFMTGEKTELEFDHIINMLLDGGRQLVVASSRPPAQLARLNDRMRSRLQRGLVTELGAMDLDLRMRIVERRLKEKRGEDPSFEIPREVVELVAEKLTESGRELEGAVTRLYAQWQLMRTPITLEGTEIILRDLVSSGDQRRIRIDDILRVVSRHYGVSRGDILSQRRHRSVVWPRQIGMYLAKQLTHRSLPEIGRRFGNRDHTTVLHAIRKIEGVIA